MVEPIHRELIIGTYITTPKQAWDRLREQFQKDTAVNKIQLMQKLFRLNQDDTSVNDHFREYHDLVAR